MASSASLTLTGEPNATASSITSAAPRGNAAEVTTSTAPAAETATTAETRVASTTTDESIAAAETAVAPTTTDESVAAAETVTTADQEDTTATSTINTETAAINSENQLEQDVSSATVTTVIEQIDSQRVTAEQSFHLTQIFICASVNSIAFIREMFADECFETRVFDPNSPDVTYEQFKDAKPALLDPTARKEMKKRGKLVWKILVRGRNPGVNKLLDWLDLGVADALKKRYLASMQLISFAGEVSFENVQEVFTISFSYGDIGVSTMEIHGVPFAIARDSIHSLVCKLVIQLQADDSPPTRGRRVSMQLAYNDSCPESYQPPGFIHSILPILAVPDKNIFVGNFDTQVHMATLSHFHRGEGEPDPVGSEGDHESTPAPALQVADPLHAYSNASEDHPVPSPALQVVNPLHAYSNASEDHPVPAHAAQRLNFLHACPNASQDQPHLVPAAETLNSIHTSASHDYDQLTPAHAAQALDPVHADPSYSEGGHQPSPSHAGLANRVEAPNPLDPYLCNPPPGPNAEIPDEVAEVAAAFERPWLKGAWRKFGGIPDYQKQDWSSLYEFLKACNAAHSHVWAKDNLNRGRHVQEANDMQEAGELSHLAWLRKKFPTYKHVHRTPASVEEKCKRTPKAKGADKEPTKTSRPRRSRNSFRLLDHSNFDSDAAFGSRETQQAELVRGMVLSRGNENSDTQLLPSPFHVLLNRSSPLATMNLSPAVLAKFSEALDENTDGGQWGCECSSNVDRCPMVKCVSCKFAKHIACYGYVTADEVPRCFVCYKCLLFSDQALLDIMKDFCQYRYYLYYLYSAGEYDSERRIASELGISIAGLNDMDNYLEFAGYLVASDGSERSGPRSFTLVKTQTQVNELFAEFFDPKRHIAQYFDLEDGPRATAPAVLPVYSESTDYGSNNGYYGYTGGVYGESRMNIPAPAIRGPSRASSYISPYPRIADRRLDGYPYLNCDIQQAPTATPTRVRSPLIRNVDGVAYVGLSPAAGLPAGVPTDLVFTMAGITYVPRHLVSPPPGNSDSGHVTGSNGYGRASADDGRSVQANLRVSGPSWRNPGHMSGAATGNGSSNRGTPSSRATSQVRLDGVKRKRPTPQHSGQQEHEGHQGSGVEQVPKRLNIGQANSRFQTGYYDEDQHMEG